METLELFLFAVVVMQIAQVQGNDLPHFVGAPSHYKVKENAEIGTIVGNITASDPVSSEILTLSLDSIGNELFDIVDSGGTKSSSGNPPLKRSLRLKKLLDREAREDYNFVITVQDNAQGDRKVPKSVGLILLDVNDNQPIFQGTPYTAKLEENTASNLVYQVSATDADLGSSKSILYSFYDDCKTADCEPFLISSTTGIVSLNTSITLDYETRSRYNLHIIAKDRGTPPLNSSITLIVEVLDVSDRPPEFEKSSYRVDIEENRPLGTSVGETKAFDDDRGINNPLTYAIIGGDDGHFFKIDNSTGVITTNAPIDSDTGSDFFQLIVQATEIPGNMSSNATVFLTVNDINDNKPTFPATGFPYTVKVSEDTPIGTPIFFEMGVTDNDTDARNAVFDYSLHGNASRFFQIHRKSGRIDLARTLDFEKETDLSFLVIARETHSIERFSSNQTVTVEVLNANDNVPRFNQDQYTFILREAIQLGAILGRIQATDDDVGIFGKITYSRSGDDADKFSVGRNSGIISVAAILDFKSKPSYHFMVEAKDGGNWITRVPVNIFSFDEINETKQHQPSDCSVPDNCEKWHSVAIVALVVSLTMIMLLTTFFGHRYCKKHSVKPDIAVVREDRLPGENHHTENHTTSIVAVPPSGGVVYEGPVLYTDLQQRDNLTTIP